MTMPTNVGATWKRELAVAEWVLTSTVYVMTPVPTWYALLGFWFWAYFILHIVQ